MIDFSQIIGHESIINHMQKAIENHKVSNAYILAGEDGAGKKILANTFAKTLQCEEGGKKPCNVCRSCMQMDGMNHPDIIYVTHEKASLGVDEIRIQVNNDIQIKPFTSPYKIYIIDDGEKMTEQAQNALLKTMEEPPEYVVIMILTDNVNRLLSTIQSRSVILNLKAVSTDAIKTFLMEKKQIPDYLAEISAQFSRGNVGLAIKYSTSEDFIQSKEMVLHVLKHIDEMELHEVMDAVKSFTANKLDVYDYIDLMTLWYRDVLMLKVTKNPNLLLYKKEYNYLVKQAAKRTYEGIEAIIRAMDKAKVRLKANVNFDIAIELMLLTIKEN